MDTIDSPEASQPQRKRPSRAFVGAMLGPMLGIVFSYARIGPAGGFWWEGKGGETFLTPLGRAIVSTLFVAGALVGAFGGRVLDAWSGQWNERTTSIR